MTLTAYYPFKGKEGTAPGTDGDGIIEANTGVANQATDMQPEIDFLWDSKTGIDKTDFSATDPEVKFTFAHKMSKITFAFQDSEEVRDPITDQLIAGPVNVSDMVNYTIKGLVLDGTFNTANGVCAVKEDTASADLDIDVEGTVTHNTPLKPLIVFPQGLKELDSGIKGVELHIYTNEDHNNTNSDLYQHYKCSLSFDDGEIKPGNHYVYTIKVTKIGLIVGKMTVQEWNEVDRALVATIDGDDPFKEKD